MRRRHYIVALTAFTLALAGCTSGSEYPELDEPAESEDQLPSSVSDDLVDVGSARLVDVENGVSVWIALPASPNHGVCVVVAQATSNVATACGRPPVELHEATLGSFSIGEPGGSGDWEQLSSSVWRRI